MSRTPCCSSFFGIGSWPHSGMPGAPCGPACFSTSTESRRRRARDRRCAPPCRCSRSNTTAGPVCRSRCGSTAAGLITAPSGARLPRSTARPSFATSGVVARPDHVVVVDLRAGDVLAERAAVDRALAERRAGRRSTRAARAARRRSRSPPSGTCPTAARWRAPACCARARRSGRGRAATPARRAIAIRCTIALVEPPSASTAVIALSIAAARRGRRAASGPPTPSRRCACRNRVAICAWRESAAGIDAAPGSVRPSASAALVIVDAVPIVMQWPGRARDAVLDLLPGLAR